MLTSPHCFNVDEVNPKSRPSSHVPFQTLLPNLQSEFFLQILTPTNSFTTSIQTNKLFLWMWPIRRVYGLVERTCVDNKLPGNFGGNGHLKGVVVFSTWNAEHNLPELARTCIKNTIMQRWFFLSRLSNTYDNPNYVQLQYFAYKTPRFSTHSCKKVQTFCVLPTRWPFFFFVACIWHRVLESPSTINDLSLENGKHFET